jgi:GNAT superfamily N-acetyltransferase
LGAPEPENFWADRDYVHGRFGAEQVASFAAELDGELVGANFVTRWGSVGFFGPLIVRADRQGRGIAKQLIEAVSAQLNEWGVRHAGLFTFPHSALRLGLYQKFGLSCPLSDCDHGCAGAAYPHPSIRRERGREGWGCLVALFRIGRG